ncbi:MAG: FAD-dependent oxidoreductase [Gammaproteobacteria bacterium]|nr:FAD-dependent oxidoreductase [Gammaproteobacteria bacterium]MCP4831151.1 FAD-dependent oxidoreductase [Gammaproteobacteria bacterium]
MHKSKLLIFSLFLLLIAVAAYFDLYQSITLENFKAQQTEANNWVTEHPFIATISYLAIYIIVTAINIPGAAAMTLIAGALFGIIKGVIIVSFASTIGATLAFLLSRYLLRNFVEQRFSSTLTRINNGIDKEGPYYLFTLRLVPLFPFFVINLVMGLTRLNVKSFFWVSQLGMLPATILYVNAGTQISQLESLQGILSPQIIGSFILLGIFPLLAKKSLTHYNTTKQQRKFTKPDSFDTNMVIIGAGSAGLVTAYIAAASGAKVTLIEKGRMGGDCLNTGCVPSKALIRSSRIKSYIDRSREFGINSGQAETDFPAVMRRVQDIITHIEPHDSIERYSTLGVDCVQGNARITSPWTVAVNNTTITTRSIVIASGGSPAIPPISGLEKIDYLTSDTLWKLDKLPERLLVLGGGAIGCELAQAFQRLGSEVTLVEMLPRLLAAEDERVATEVETAFHFAGINVLINCRAKSFEPGNILICDDASGERQIEFDKVLIATGRHGNSKELGLGTLGIEARPNGTIPVNDFLQTIYPNIYACGDVAGPYQLTHAAAHQAWYCVVNALFGHFWKFRVDYSVLPRAIFCDPEVASVGINEQQAYEQKIAHEVTTYEIDDLDRAIADGEAKGFVRVITPPNSDKILGVTIVGSHAGDIISEYVLAMQNGLGLSKILGTVHIYPTLAEANKFAAGNWRKAHLSARLIRLSGWLNARKIKASGGK